MKCSQEGLALIKKFEGCKLKAYKCSAGVWTIGYGHTAGVKEGDVISQPEADKLLEEDIALCEFVDVSKNELQKLLRRGLNLLMED